MEGELCPVPAAYRWSEASRLLLPTPERAGDPWGPSQVSTEVETGERAWG